MTSPLHISRGLEACIAELPSEEIILSPTRMRPLLDCTRTLPLASLLWLGFATYVAQAWAWGPSTHHHHNNEWNNGHGPKHAELMYRAVHPRNSTASYFNSDNGTYRSRPDSNTTGTIPLSTSRPSPVTSNSSLDKTCGETGSLFNIQISQADGDNDLFNGWWLKLSGDMVLFTSQKEKATGFGVSQGTRHLCIPRTGSLPLIAIVETRLATSPLYFLDANFSRGYEPEYEPIVCDGQGGNGSQLSCAQETRTSWTGCGLQLELGAEASSNGTEGGSGCSSIALYAFQS
ncbi:hypothetical protein VMCG_06086 [Cytospora schulzeri]|uniref:Uncharacterized protein n=1 Tax=Cytospora schulzeri TaxID=448051 RepID=A0A423WGK6_9PEZI|nr:hypothetical protein VMCG_06086 [Valsa malicola]